MDFLLTEEQKTLKESIRAFAAKDIAPRVRERADKAVWPADLTRKLGERGLLGIPFPRECGGSGRSLADCVIIVEELSKANPSVGLAVAAHNSLCCLHIHRFGNDSQKKKYLPLLFSGRTLGAWAMIEAGAGLNAAALRTKAEKKGGDWILNGSTPHVTNGFLADVAVVMAVTDPAKGRNGLSAFILEKGMAGFKAGKKEDALGAGAVGASELVFEDVRIPAENILGEPNTGRRQALSILDGGRVSIAAFALGVAAGALETALKFSMERVRFRRPDSRFQDIREKLADGMMELEAARLLTFRAAFLEDERKGNPKESAMAALSAGELAVKVSNDAVQILGGCGFTKDSPAEKSARDSPLAAIDEGMSEIRRWVIAHQAFEGF